VTKQSAERAARTAIAAAVLLAAVGGWATAGEMRKGAVPVGIADLPHAGDANQTETAKDLGLNFLHTKVRWDEPTEGDYAWTDFADDDPLAKRLKQLKADGYAVAVTFKNVDDDRKHLPRYLAGRAFNDPALLARWTAFLEAFLGRYGDHVDFVNIGYKVNNYFGKHEKEWAGFVRFVAVGSRLIRQKRPRVSIGVVLNDDDDPARFWRDVSPVCTHLALVYTVPASIIVSNPPASAVNPRHAKFFGRTLESAVRMAGPRKVLLLDVSCPTHTSIDASPALQARFITLLFGWLRRAESRVAGLTYVGDKDWPYEATKNALKKMFGDRILEYRGLIRYLTSCGLRDENGRKKPGYAAFKNGLEAYRKGR